MIMGILQWFSSRDIGFPVDEWIYVAIEQRHLDARRRRITLPRTDGGFGDNENLAWVLSRDNCCSYD
jgi:hypothetical protein